MAWLCCAAWRPSIPSKPENDDERIGVDIVKRAIEFPTRALAENAGVEGSVVVQEVKKRKGNEGYNVATGDYEDLVKAGVVDPKKVTRTALQNAASIAGLLLTTECLITEIPEKEKKAPMPGGQAAAWAAKWITKPFVGILNRQNLKRGWFIPASLFCVKEAGSSVFFGGAVEVLPRFPRGITVSTLPSPGVMTAGSRSCDSPWPAAP